MKKLSRAAAFLSIVAGAGLLSAQAPSAPPPPLPTAADQDQADVEMPPSTGPALEDPPPASPAPIEEPASEQLSPTAESADEYEENAVEPPVLQEPAPNQDRLRRITVLELPKSRSVDRRDPAAIQTQKLIHERERNWAMQRRAIISARKQAGISVSRPNATDIQRYGRYESRNYYGPSGLKVIYGFRAQPPANPF